MDKKTLVLNAMASKSAKTSISNDLPKQKLYSKTLFFLLCKKLLIKLAFAFYYFILAPFKNSYQFVPHSILFVWWGVTWFLWVFSQKLQISLGFLNFPWFHFLPRFLGELCLLMDDDGRSLMSVSSKIHFLLNFELRENLTSEVSA